MIPKQMLPRGLPDAPQMIPPCSLLNGCSSMMAPPRCLLNDYFSMIPLPIVFLS
jgi:hypothetical protein